MENPQEPPKPQPEEEQWSDEPSAVEHLTDGNFEDFISKHDSVLVMFYAPCKQILVWSMLSDNCRGRDILIQPCSALLIENRFL